MNTHDCESSKSLGMFPRLVHVVEKLFSKKGVSVPPFKQPTAELLFLLARTHKPKRKTEVSTESVVSE